MPKPIKKHFLPVVDKMVQNKKIDLSGRFHAKKYEVCKSLNTKGLSGQSKSYANTLTNRSFCNVCLSESQLFKHQRHVPYQRPED